MDFLYAKVRIIRGLLTPQKKTEQLREVTRFEGYLQLVHKILTWSDVSLTLTVFLVLNFIFWLVVQLELRCLGTAFLLVLVAFVGDFYVEDMNFLKVETEHLKALDQWKERFVELVKMLKGWRDSSSGTFCVVMLSIFLGCSVLAQSISGYVLFYLMLLSIFFVPLAIQNIPEEYQNRCKYVWKTLTSNNDDLITEEDLMPKLSAVASNQPSTSQDIFNTLLLGSMPSHDEVDQEKDSLTEDDLLPTRDVSFTPDSTDSDSEHRDIGFDSRHFTGDTSSEEENHYVKGLAEAVNDKEVFANIVSSVATAGGNLMANVMKMATSPQKRKDSSSDSDFEILERPDDMDENY